MSPINSLEFAEDGPYEPEAPASEFRRDEPEAPASEFRRDEPEAPASEFRRDEPEAPASAWKRQRGLRGHSAMHSLALRAHRAGEAWTWPERPPESVGAPCVWVGSAPIFEAPGSATDRSDRETSGRDHPGGALPALKNGVRARATSFGSGNRRSRSLAIIRLTIAARSTCSAGRGRRRHRRSRRDWQPFEHCRQFPKIACAATLQSSEVPATFERAGPKIAENRYRRARHENSDKPRDSIGTPAGIVSSDQRFSSSRWLARPTVSKSRRTRAASTRCPPCASPPPSPNTVELAITLR